MQRNLKLGKVNSALQKQEFNSLESFSNYFLSIYGIVYSQDSKLREVSKVIKMCQVKNTMLHIFDIRINTFKFVIRVI